MNLGTEELRSLVERGEGLEIEFKRGLPRRENVGRSLAAFANTRGGWFLVGVEDDGRVCGAPHPKRSVERIREIAAEWVEPPLSVEITTVELPEGKVVACWVPLSALRPHASRCGDQTHEVVVRAGSSNRRASGATLRAIARPTRGAAGLAPLERSVLIWVAERGRGSTAGATVEGFARACNVGKQRARRAFVKLEVEGLLVAHGLGARRTYSRA